MEWVCLVPGSSLKLNVEITERLKPKIQTEQSLLSCGQFQLCLLKNKEVKTLTYFCFAFISAEKMVKMENSVSGLRWR